MKKDSTKTSKTQASSLTEKFTAFDGNFPVLYIRFTLISNVFSGAIKKIVFQFNFDDAISGQPTLNGYGLKNNGKFGPPNPSPSGITLLKAVTTFPIGYPFSLGNLELSKDMYDALNGDSNKKTYLIFTPEKTNYNAVIYWTSWNDNIPVTAHVKSKIKPLSVTFDLNPSPPRDPLIN